MGKTNYKLCKEYAITHIYLTGDTPAHLENRTRHDEYYQGYLEAIANIIYMLTRCEPRISNEKHLMIKVELVRDDEVIESHMFSKFITHFV